MLNRLMRRWEVTTSSGKHFQVLDGLRGMAILLVIVFHTFYTNPSSSAVASGIQYLIFSGWIGVPIFFVLSGFLISYPFFKARKQSPQFWYLRGYTVRRLGKILPPFYLSIAIFTVFYWVLFHNTDYLKSALFWAIGWESYGLPITDFNLSYWSLMVEIHFYGLLPILFFLTRGLTLGKTTVATVACLLLLPLLLRLLAWPWGISVLPPNHTGTEINFFVQRFPFCQLDYFAFGLAFAGIFAAIETRLVDFKKLALLGYLGVAALTFTLIYWAYACKTYGVHVHPQHWSIETFKYAAGGSSFLLLFFLFDADCLGARLFGSSWLRFIGIVSYEWFLFHGPIVVWFRHLFGRTEGHIFLYVGKTILPLALTFVFSVLVYHYFSQPILNRVRNSLKK
jgi:peptidoglycan/LPS O-acetylase OafA/YrhL